MGFAMESGWLRALVLVVCVQVGRSCDWPLITDEGGRTLPDTFVRISATYQDARAGHGVETERGVFMGKASSFGPCPLLIGAAVAHPIKLAKAAGLLLLFSCGWVGF